MVLYWDLVKIAFGFAVVKNSCEGIKTIFSVGLWSCSLGVKYEGIIGVILTYLETFHLATFNFDTECFLSCFLSHSVEG